MDPGRPRKFCSIFIVLGSWQILYRYIWSGDKCQIALRIFPVPINRLSRHQWSRFHILIGSGFALLTSALALKKFRLVMKISKRLGGIKQ